MTCPQGKYSPNCSKLFNLDKGLKGAGIIKSRSRSGAEARGERRTQTCRGSSTHFTSNFSEFSVSKLWGPCLRNSERVAADSVAGVRCRVCSCSGCCWRKVRGGLRGRFTSCCCSAPALQGRTVLQMLQCFALYCRQFMEQHGEFSPVCVYMRDEVS